ncbi:dihydroxyacetone kinase subunit DhaL [Flavobacterium nackdongense]|uniref:Dihydroxyacetone kinase subunit L n=1 Tax=Flavobacterium nackdongense TaxID=2547394 RepID=A0A4P6YBI4_9FLAO|nr:dihydroxyacetone kinase subunit DhaL [Flavobacterium nackdongense]QBN20486.1 dihydroxyacetone kinase subunit L [Flavobacterium nackdongense]
MQTFTNKEGAVIIDQLIIAIQENKQYLSDIDGLIGDGDHGINMNKGFTICREELDKNPGDMAYGLKVLAKILMMKIGGSMGPLYGKFFKAMGIALEGKEVIGIEEMGEALKDAVDAIASISPAKVGDKTLIDTLIPAVMAYVNAHAEGKSFSEAFEAMKCAAIEGRDSTKDMVAKLGRASRLGERSRGVLDAGATSCCLILEVLGNQAQILLENKFVKI